jgi:signal transduction histidine kinase
MNRHIYFPAIRLSLIYLVITGFWIFLSDRILLALLQGDSATLTNLQSIKGFGFVVVMAALLYFERLAGERANQGAGQALHDAERKYRGLFEYAPVGIFRATVDGTYLDVNTTFASILGYDSPQELTGRLDNPPPGAYGSHTPDSLPHRYERTYTRKDGSQLDAQVHLQYRTAEGDLPAYVEGFVEDITERVALDQRVQAQQATLRDYTHQLVRSQEEERKRIARELHDETLQELVALGQRAELARALVERDPAGAARRLEDLQALAKELITKLRHISNDLRPPILEDLGLASAMQYISDDLAGHMPHCAVNCQITGANRRLDPDLELTAFRVVQQAAANVRTHAPQSTRVDVRLAFGADAIVASVQDNGPGFVVIDTQELLRQGHLGLAGMRERAAILGGVVDVVSTPGSGTTISLWLPYDADNEDAGFDVSRLGEE